MWKPLQCPSKRSLDLHTAVILHSSHGRVCTVRFDLLVLRENSCPVKRKKENRKVNGRKEKKGEEKKRILILMFRGMIELDCIVLYWIVVKGIRNSIVSKHKRWIVGALRLFHNRGMDNINHYEHNTLPCNGRTDMLTATQSKIIFNLCIVF